MFYDIIITCISCAPFGCTGISRGCARRGIITTLSPKEKESYFSKLEPSIFAQMNKKQSFISH